MREFPKRCASCGGGAKWEHRLQSPGGRLYGYCSRCGGATPIEQLSADVFRVEKFEDLARFRAPQPILSETLDTRQPTA